MTMTVSTRPDRMSLLFLIVGGALLPFGLWWFITGLQGGYFGADLQLWVGLFATIIGLSLIMIGIYDRRKQAKVSH